MFSPSKGSLLSHFGSQLSESSASSILLLHSKALSFAIWDPLKNRATVHSFKGQMFGSIGLTVRTTLPANAESKKPKVITTFELLPEETLYLIERGVLQCCIEVSTSSIDEGMNEKKKDSDFLKATKSGMGLTSKILEEYDLESLVPMSVQEAFSRILGRDECTREKYQVSSAKAMNEKRDPLY